MELESEIQGKDAALGCREAEISNLRDKIAREVEMWATKATRLENQGRTQLQISRDAAVMKDQQVIAQSGRIDSLQQQLGDATTKIEQADQRGDVLTAKLGLLREELDGRVGVEAELQCLITQLEADKAGANLALQAAQRQHSVVDTTAANLKQELARLDGVKLDAALDAERGKHERTADIQRREIAEQRAVAARDELKALREELSSQRRMRQRADDECCELQVTTARLTAELQQLRSETSHGAAEVPLIAARLNDALEKLNQQEIEMVEVKAKNSTMESALVALSHSAHPQTLSVPQSKTSTAVDNNPTAIRVQPLLSWPIYYYDN